MKGETRGAEVRERAGELFSEGRMSPGLQD